MNIFKKGINLFVPTKRSVNTDGMLFNQMDSYPKKEGLLLKLRKTRQYQYDFEMATFTTALNAARNPLRYDRRLLQEIYNQIKIDCHLTSQIQTRENEFLSEGFSIVDHKTKTKNDDLTELLERPWFYQLQKEYIQTIMHGFTLIQFYEPKDEGGGLKEFYKFDVIPRGFVSPELGIVRLNEVSLYGVPYREGVLADKGRLLEIGENSDLGLLACAAIEVNWKRYARTDWARLCEKYGIPMTFIKTDTEDEKQLQEYEDMLANSGSNLYGIIKKDDEVEMLSLSAKGQQEMFENKAKFCNEEMSKLLVGQTSTSDQKAFVGAADVHESILAGYTQSDMRSFFYWANWTLLPFLIQYGYPLQGYRFMWNRQMEQHKKPSDISDEPDGDPMADNEKKKPARKVARRITRAAQNADGDIWDRLTGKVWKASGKLKGIDADTFRHTAKLYSQAVIEGFCTGFGSIDGTSLEKLKNSAHVFSAHKNAAYIQELNDLLIGEDGKIRPRKEFLSVAKGVNQNWNETWFDVEYNNAISAAQAARQWSDIERTKKTLGVLQYCTMGDHNVREAHAKLNGLTRPVDDPVWETYFIPNGHGCRCWIKQLRTGTATTSDKQMGEMTDVKPDKGFAMNTGKTLNAFGDDPYINKLTNEQVKQAEREAEKLKIETLGANDIRAIQNWTGTDGDGIQAFQKGLIKKNSSDYAIFKERSEQIEATIKKMPTFDDKPVFNTEPVSEEYALKIMKLKKGDSFTFGFTTPVSTLQEVTDDFKGDGLYILSVIQPKTAADISKYSTKPFEMEALMSKFAKYEVVGVKREGNCITLNLKQNE